MDVLGVKKLTKVAFITATVPLFFNLNGSVFKGSTLDQDIFALPLGFFISVAVLFLNKEFVKNIITSKNVLFVLTVLALILCYFCGVILGNGSPNPQLLMISLLPFVFSYVIGITARKEFRSNLDNFIGEVVVCCGIISLSHIISSIVELGILGAFVNRGSDTIFGLFSVYQKLVYYPTILSFVFILSLYLKGRYYKYSGYIIFILIAIIGSRESFVLCFLGLLSKNYFNFLEKKYKKIIFFLLLVMFFLVLLYQIMPYLFENYADVTIIKKITSLNESGDYSAGRGDAINKVFGSSSGEVNTFYGTGFSMSRGDLRTPHNQYLELYLRGGILTLVPIIFLFINSLRYGLVDTKKSIRFKKVKSIFSLWLILLLYILVSFNVNTPMRAPYGAMLFGLVCGFFNYRSDYE